MEHEEWRVKNERTGVEHRMISREQRMKNEKEKSRWKVYVGERRVK